MSDNKSEAKKERKGGMVFYPRSYHLTDDLNTSYAIGVNHKDQLFAALIIPAEANQIAASKGNTAQTIPTFSEFAEVGRKAQNPCYCSPDNSPKNPCGVMVLEQIKHDPERTKSGNFNGLHVYVAKWASVVREADDMPRSPVGPGYVEVGFTKSTDPQVNELLTQYDEVNVMLENNEINALDAEDKKDSLYKQIVKAQRKWFTTVMLRHKEIFLFEDPTPKNIRMYAYSLLLKYTKKGMYGGVIFRVRDGKNIIGTLTRICNMGFDYKNRSVQNLDDILNDFMKYSGNKISKEVIEKGYILEAIPTIRINCGPRGVDKFSKEFTSSGTPKVMKTYVAKEFHNNPNVNIINGHGFLFADIAVRLYEVPEHKKDAGNLLVSTVHAFSAPKGNSLTIDESGESVYYFKTEHAKSLEPA